MNNSQSGKLYDWYTAYMALVEALDDFAKARRSTDATAVWFDMKPPVETTTQSLDPVYSLDFEERYGGTQRAAVSAVTICAEYLKAELIEEGGYPEFQPLLDDIEAATVSENAAEEWLGRFAR